MLSNTHKPQIVRVSPTVAVTKGAEDQIITDAVAQGFGALVSWGYRSAFGATPSQIEGAFKASGINITVAELSDAHGCRQGCTAFRKYRLNGDVYRAEVSDKSSGEITISVQKQIKIGKKTDWIATESLSFSQGAFQAPANTEAGKRVQSLVEFRKEHYTGMEFTRWVLKPLMLNNNAVKLQDIDGLYYMIESKMDLVAEMKVACGLLDVRFRKRNLLKSTDNVSDMAENAKEGLVDRVNSVKETLATWEAKSKIRKSSSEALYSELDAIKDEAEVLADALGFALEEIVSSLASAKERAVDMIVGKTEGSIDAPAPQEASVARWSALLREDFLLADDEEIKVFCIPMSDVLAGGVPASTAKSNYYYKGGQVHARALAHLGFYGVIQDGDLIVQSI